MRIDSREVPRKILHILIGTVFLVLMILNVITPLILFAVIVVSAGLSVLSRKMRVPVLGYFLENFDREKDRKSFPGKGAIAMFVGMLLAWKLFPAEIAFASITVAILGDAVSHLIGTHLGKIPNPFDSLKNFEGNLMGGVAGSIGAMIFVNPWLAAMGSFGAMIIEGIQVKMNDTIVDDNIIIPLAAGAIMTLMRAVFYTYVA